MPRESINSISKEEFDAICKRVDEKIETACLWCGKLTWMRTGQKFCKPACKTAYSRGVARAIQDKLLREQERWRDEREALVKEVARLTQENAKLRADYGNITRAS